MRDIRKSNKGFTLIELVIVIAILAILTVVVAPQYFSYVEKSKTTVCQANRRIIERAYGHEIVLNGDVTLAEVLAEYSSDSKTELCPSKGVYTVSEAEGQIICSLHKAGGVEPEPEPSGGTGNTVTLPNGTEATLSDWGGFLEKAAGNYGCNIPHGTIVSDGTGTYMVRNSPYLGAQDAQNGISFADFAAKNPFSVIELDMSMTLTTDNIESNGQWKTELRPGMIYSHGDSTYVLVESAGVWVPTDPTAHPNLWLKLN